MEKIQAYETTDGKLFKDEAEATQHQQDLDTKSSLKAFADKHGFSGMTRTDVYEILFENRDELRRILA